MDDRERDRVLIHKGAGNCATVDNNGVLYVTGFAQNEFTPIIGQACTFFYDEINRTGAVTDGSDAILAVIQPDLRTSFCTYWGGSGLGADNHDEGNTVAIGKNLLNKQFVLLSGWTNSGKKSAGNETIPVCYESEDIRRYYFEDQFDQQDAFVSKLYLDDCLVVSTDAPHKSTAGLEIMPNPTSGLIQILLGQSHSIASIQIFSAAGQDMDQKVQISDPERGFLNISELPSGCYLLSLLLEDGSRVSAPFIKI